MIACGKMHLRSESAQPLTTSNLIYNKKAFDWMRTAHSLPYGGEGGLPDRDPLERDPPVNKNHRQV